MRRRAPRPADLFVGARFREARRAKGLGQPEVAEQLGISYQQVQKYERGTIRLSASTLVLAAKVLGVAPGWFFEGMPEALVGAAEGKPTKLQAFVVSRQGQEWIRLGSELSNEALEQLMAVARLILRQ
jgi:transcriptional regulator with XRE-family HTH domain